MTPILVAFGSIIAVYLYVRYRRNKSINHVSQTYDGDVYKKYHKRRPFSPNNRHQKRPDNGILGRKPYSVTMENPKIKETSINTENEKIQK